jgi:hypothetical protein
MESRSLSNTSLTMDVRIVRQLFPWIDNNIATSQRGIVEDGERYSIET